MEGKQDNNQDIYSIIKNNKKSIIVSFIIIFLLIFLLVFLSGVDDVLQALSRTNLWLFGLTFIIQTVVIIFWALRWKLILDSMHYSPSFKNVVGMLLTSMFGNNITPGSIGGEPLRAYILKEYNETPIEVGFASAMADRIFEMFPFVLMSLVSIIVIIAWDLDIFAKIFLLGLVLCAFIIFALIIYTGINKRVASNLSSKLINFLAPIVTKFTKKDYDLIAINEEANVYITNFNSNFRLMVDNKKLFIVGCFLALLCWALDLGNSYLAFIAIGVEPPIAPFITIFTISILLSFVPMLPGALGVTEIIMIALFVPLGIYSDQVLAASALERMASYIFPTVLGLFATFYYTKFLTNKKKNKSNKQSDS